ncbi:MAG: RluA family pseudouridine synthase [Coriobacteriales bacterium]|jgi:23S rRNA pseudouridine1911/1915/1917 synthase|nr:RluA family pseudouridine synthase [Coriobacteriales bacterium]
MTRFEHVVEPFEKGRRLDTLLAALEGVDSREAAVRLIGRGKVTLNGEVTTTKRRIVLEGDAVVYVVEPPQPFSLLAEDIPLDIRYEDDDIIVLSKPAGLVVHPAQGHESGTLVNALIAHCGYESLSLVQGEERPGIVHRLDMQTSGLMIVAKSEVAGHALKDAIRVRSVERRYLALVHGSVAPDTGLIDAPLSRGTDDRQRVFVTDERSARQSVTTFRVLERFEADTHDDGYTLVECKLYTGRTHQIRVHMEYIGHACVGDPVYGPRNRPKAQLGLERQFLHAWRLSFAHPVTEADMDFCEQLPEELAVPLASLAERSRGRTEVGKELLGQ